MTQIAKNMKVIQDDNDNDDQGQFFKSEIVKKRDDSKYVSAEYKHMQLKKFKKSDKIDLPIK